MIFGKHLQKNSVVQAVFGPMNYTNFLFQPHDWQEKKHLHHIMLTACSAILECFKANSNAL